MSRPSRPASGTPGAGAGSVSLGEYAAWGAGVGGAAVWALAAAARAGWLRVLLDLYPRSSWERITWVLIPVLLLLPLIAQGIAVASVAPLRPVPAGRGITGSIAGTLLGLAAGLVVFVLAGRLFASVTRQALPAARAVPVPLVLACLGLLVGASLNLTARSRGIAPLRSAAIPAAAAVAGIAWLGARGWVMAASSVLERAETAVFFIAVAAAGAVGAAWSVAGIERTR